MDNKALEAAARAIAIKHYSERFGKPADDPHVLMNAAGNWGIFVDDASAAIASYEAARETGWRDIETVPNNVFDVLAKHYDAGLDQFMFVRFAGCVQVDGRILWPMPFSGQNFDLAEWGYRPVMWMDVPAAPLPEQETRP